MTKATVIWLDAAVEAQPSTFVGSTATGDLVYVDLAGHIQRTLAQGVVEIAFAPTTGLVAYSHTRSCGVDFAYVDGGAPPTAIDNASAPIFGPGGAQLSYQVCGDGRRVRTLATGADTDTPADFVVALPDSVHGELPTLRGRFGTVAFFDGSNIASYDPATGKVVTLVHPAGRVLSLDADESGRYLIWTDANLDVWTWSGGEPVKVGSGFNSAAW